MPSKKEILAYSLVIFLVVLGIFILSAMSYLLYQKFKTPPKEDYMFLSNDYINAEECKKRYMAEYQKCVDRSGGSDPLGNCWAQTEPNIKVCDVVGGN